MSALVSMHPEWAWCSLCGAYHAPGACAPRQLVAQRCPVCNGRGFMPSSFYSGLPVMTSEPCRTCHGRTILWVSAAC